MSAGVLYVEILPTTSKISSRIEKETEASFRGAEKSGSGFFSKLTGWAKTGALVVGGMVAAVGALAVGGGISRALNIEDAQAKLKGLGHDTQAIEAIMTDALASVKGTAFGLDAAATTAAAAVASGIKPGQELERYLRLTADAATIAGVSMEEMGSIINKVQAKGVAQMEDLNRLTERGIPIMQWLADEYGVTADAMSEMVSRGEVDAETFRRAIETNIGGAALSAGDTTRGAFANMMAALSRLGEVFVGDGLSAAKTFFNEVTVILDGLATRFKPWVAEIQGSIGEAFTIEGFGQRFLDAFDRMVVAIQSGPIPQLLSALAPIIPALLELAKIVGSALGDAFRELGTALAPVLPMIAETLADAVVELAPALTDLLVSLVPLIPSLIELAAAVLPLAVMLLELLVPAVVWLVDLLVEAIDPITAFFNLLSGGTDVSGFIASLDQAADAPGTLLRVLLDAGAGFVSFTESAIQTVSALGSFIAGALSAIGGFFASTWANIGLTVSSGVGAVVSLVQSLPSRITAALAGAGTWLVQVGRDIIQGLINGVSGMIQNAINAVQNVGGAMLDGVKSFLGIKSPSRVFRDEVGKMVGLGLLEGVGDAAINGRIDSAVQHMVNVPSMAGSASGAFPAVVTLVDTDGSIIAHTRTAIADASSAGGTRVSRGTDRRF